MSYNFTLTTVIPATAREIYDAWLNSLTHSQMTGGKASITDVVGAEISAWDGYITGRNLELVSGERIVQTWRTADFADEHDDSIVTITLRDVEGGTLLSLVHSNVPDAQTTYELGGWQENYFKPMMAHFDKARAAKSAPPATPTAPPLAAKRAAAKPKAKPAQPVAKTTTKRKALPTKSRVKNATKKAAKKKVAKKKVMKKKAAKKKTVAKKATKKPAAKKKIATKLPGRASRRR